MNQNDENKLDWMYKGAHSHVDEEEYLLGKSVDKTFEQLNNEKKEKKLGIAPPKNHVEHECIPPSIRDFNKIVQEEQVDLSAKLQEDPLAAIKKQEEEARRQFLQNPIQLKKLQEALEAQKKKKKKKKRSKNEDDLDKKLSEKLKYLKGNSTPINLLNNKKKENHLDTILMHKFNHLKDKLSQKDMDDILAGRCSSDSDQDNTKNKISRSDSEDSEPKRSNGQFNKGIPEKLNHKKERNSLKDKINNRDRSSSREYEKKALKKERSRTKKHRDSSSSSEYEDTASKRRNKTRKRRDSSSGSEDEKKKSKIERNKTIKHRNRSSSSEYDDKRGRNKTRKHRNRSSSSEYEKIASKRERKHRDGSSSRDNENKKYKKETRKHRDSSSDSHTNKGHKKQRKRSKSSDRISDRNGYNRQEYMKKNRNDSTKENNTKIQTIEKDHLDKMILEKLRMIRDSNPENAKEVQEEPLPTYSHYDSDNDEYVYKKKSFGLVRSDGTKIPLKAPTEQIKTVQKKIEPTKAPEQKKYQNKKLSDKEKEELRKQMMVDAVKRDKERSDNLRKFKQENEKDENKVEDFDKNFIHRQLSKSQKNLIDVESRIKSKLNNIQRSSQHMNSNFSKRS